MKLLMKSFFVKKIEFYDRTKWEDDTLYINVDELKSLILKDHNLVDVKVEIVYPGESARIVHILDSVEPRTKIGSSGSIFPGFLGPAHTVGNGITIRLAGMAVLGIAADLESQKIEAGVLEFNEGIIDMSGPGQKYGACSNTVNLCLLLRRKNGCSLVEYDNSSRLASLKVADYLAKTCSDKTPSEEHVYHLNKVEKDLPKIVYINQIQSQGFLCRTFLYALPMEDNFTPTMLHPNELLDGAVVSSNYRNMLRACTYLQQNNPFSTELQKRHGKDLCYVGQIIGRGHFDDYLMKERTGQYAAKLAKLSGAQAAVISLEGSGNAFVDLMANVKALENSQICAIPIVHEFGGPDGRDDPLPDVASEAISIISGGGIERKIEIPGMERVIGGEKIKFVNGELAFKPLDASVGFTANHNNFFCGFWQMQIGGVTSVDF